MFDPYHKWLGIRPEHQPADHYRLLGLEQFESDLDVIQSAGERQIAHVRSYSFGPHAQLSQKILNEIARAKSCLLNPVEKADYDANLRGAATPPPHGARVVPPPVAPPIAVAADAPIFQARVSQNLARKRRYRSRNIGLIISLACLTIIIAAISFTFLYVPEQQQSAAQASKKSLPPPSDPIPNSPQGKKRSQPPNPRTPRSQQPPAPPDAPKKLPVPSEQEKARARSDITIEGELSPQEFLEAAATAENSTMQFVLYELAIDAALKLEGDPSASRLALRAVAELEKRFDLPAEYRQRVLERLFRLDQQSPKPFTFTPPRLAPPPATASPERITEPTIDAPRIDLTRTQVEFPLDLNMDSVVHSELHIMGFGLGSVELRDRLPPEGIAKLGKPVRLVLRAQHPKAALEVSLHGVESLYVRIKPIMEDYDGKLYPWTQSRMKTLQGVLIREVRKCETRIPFLQQQIPLLKANLNTVRSQPRNLYNRESLNLQQGQMEARLAAAENELNALKAKLPELQRQVTGFQELFDLAESIHLQGHVEFRVYHYIDNRERTLVQALAANAAAEDGPSPLDPKAPAPLPPGRR